MSEEKVLVKDDSDLYEWIVHGQKERRALGIPEPSETRLTAPVTAKAEWQRMQQARTAPGTYYVVIEYKNGVYRAHAFSFPEVTAQGETVEAVREAMAQALQAHFADLRARGEVVSVREYKRVDTVEVPFEEVEAQPAAVAEEEVFEPG